MRLKRVGRGLTMLVVTVVVLTVGVISLVLIKVLNSEVGVLR